MNDFKRFEQLILNGTACIYMVTYEERYALEIVRETARQLGRDMWIWSLAGGVRDGQLDGSAYVPDTESPSAGLISFAKAKQGSICVALDLADQLIKQGKPLRLLRDMIDSYHQSLITLVLIDHADTLPDVIKSYAVSFEISYPDEDELKSIIKASLELIHRKTQLEIGITPKGLDAVVRNLRGLTRRQAARIIRETAADKRFSDNDLHSIIASKRRIIHKDGLLEFIQTPLNLDEIGGMTFLKHWLNQRKDAFSPEARTFGLEPPRGVLMLGVQGAGKSLCAKAIATAWQQPLLRLDPGTLYNSYIGKSEHNLREALYQTEMMSPVILWVDEIEKAFASAASHSADGGLSQRMFGTLLTWMQEHSSPVFMVATANDIEALPPELLRKGRFDEIFFVDLPNEETRREIFSIHLKKRHHDPAQFDLAALAQASEGFSGSDIEVAVMSALHSAFSNKQPLDTGQILQSIRQSPPLSVTMAERIEQLRQWAHGRCVMAG